MCGCTGDFQWSMFNFSRSCSVDCGLWFRKWSGLLDCEEFMGKAVGNGWLYSRSTQQWKCSRSLRDQHASFISNEVWTKPSYTPRSNQMQSFYAVWRRGNLLLWYAHFRNMLFVEMLWIEFCRLL